MDKNTITGLLLIAAIIIGFSIYNRPTQEQLAQQKRLRDSLELVETQRAERAAQQQTTKSEVSLTQQQNTVAEFFGVGQPATALTDSLTADTDSTVQAAPTDSLGTGMSIAESSDMPVLENEHVRVVLNPQGGAVYSVQIKDRLRYNGDSLFLFEGDEARFNLELYNRNSVRLSTEDQVFTPITSADGRSVTMRLQSGGNQYIDFVYTLPADEYMMNFDIRVSGMRNGLHPESLTNFKMNWEQKLRRQEKGRNFENRFSRIHYKYDKQDVQRMSESKTDKKELTEPLKWFAFKDQFFSAVVIGDKPFNNAILSSTVLQSEEYLKEYKAEAWMPITMSADEDLITAGFNYYFGPVHYKTLKAYDQNVADSSDKLDLQELVYLGYRWLSWINKWFVIPVFNFFLSLNWNMGLIILILTLMVKIIVSPLTFKSFKSSAKMRVLRPQIKALEEKYPGQDREMMMKRQQATMELYNKVGVSPMSGCLPQLIQMPVLLALFFFFPSAIELRGESFLWAEDLSTFDSIISWEGNIPFISRFLGNHISLFCLLMTIVNVVYTRHTMAAADTGQQSMAGMKHMPIFMSVFMFFFLNSYPAGLNYYYFLSTLITILITFSFKKFVDEEKLLAELEANKKKPRKQSGFMARLAEAQKMQEKQARERAKATAKRNYRR